MSWSAGRGCCIRPTGRTWRSAGRSRVRRWGEGLAGEAGRAAVDWARQALGARHIISLIEPRNARSIRVAEKLGMSQEGEIELRGHSLRIYGLDLSAA
jgi:RimJ/RimL family protein N-acetyltransferase